MADRNDPNQIAWDQPRDSEESNQTTMPGQSDGAQSSGMYQRADAQSSGTYQQYSNVDPNRPPTGHATSEQSGKQQIEVTTPTRKRGPLANFLLILITVISLLVIAYLGDFLGMQHWVNEKFESGNSASAYSGHTTDGDKSQDSSATEGQQGDSSNTDGRKKAKASDNADDAYMQALYLTDNYPYSKKKLEDELISGSNQNHPTFTRTAAEKAMGRLKYDYKEAAAKCARSYQLNLKMKPEEIHDQLMSSSEGYTKEEADYAIQHLRG